MNEKNDKAAQTPATLAHHGDSRAVAFVTVLLLCAVLLLDGLGRPALFEPDEGRNAEKAREILLLNDWITPHENFTVVLDKPIAYYWLVAASYKVFGVSEWSARLPSAFAAGACAVLVFLFGRRFFGFWEGLWSSLVLVTSLEFYILARIVILDMVLTLCTTVALVCFFSVLRDDNGRSRKLLLVLMYAALAAGTLVKGPLGVLLPSMVMLPFLILTRQVSALRRLALPLGTLTLLIVVVPWYYQVEKHNPGYLRYFLWEEHFLRYFTPHFRRGEPWFYFLLVLAVGFIPWTLCIPAVMKESWRERKDETTLGLIVWTIVPLIFFSLSRAKLPHYILPIFPPLALLTGLVLVRRMDAPALKPGRLLFNTSLFLLLTVLCFVIAVSWPDVMPPGARAAMVAISPQVHSFGWMTALVLLGLTFSLLRAYGKTQLILYFSLGFILYMHFAGYFLEAASNNRSTRELAKNAFRFIEPGTRPVLYDLRYETLLFYLKSDRPVWFVNSGERTNPMGSFYLAEQGARPAPGYAKAFLTFAEFNAEWAKARNGQFLVFLKKRNLTRIEHGATLAKLLLEQNDLLVVTNWRDKQ
jgi:4-amino-4-deoxy-L-arabinose transferase-like glycosyltransferase